MELTITFVFLGIVIILAIIANRLNIPFLKQRFWFNFYLAVTIVFGLNGLFSTDFSFVIKAWSIFYSYCVYDYFKRNLLKKFLEKLQGETHENSN